MTISIHALREEGDVSADFSGIVPGISIHALREEGDAQRARHGRYFLISIHALREEGDRQATNTTANLRYFYPRPPRGGRRGP